MTPFTSFLPIHWGISGHSSCTKRERTIPSSSSSITYSLPANPHINLTDPTGPPNHDDSSSDTHHACSPASIVPKKGKGKEYYHHQVTFVTRNKCFKNIGALLLVYTDLSCFYALGPLTSMTNNLTQAYYTGVFHVIALSAMFSKLALAAVFHISGITHSSPAQAPNISPVCPRTLSLVF
eukprot:jgi/Psemu1/60615/gm1.60615_g